ncbi:hypothetical protein [Gluconobacter morbifer]|uniref:hypothetical protein n=1 Tax=Gluconobacter morbifer TaxID=479935 RepID=UPI00031A47F3|nr:hypothetical protein [Gluconobacter morbifer]
MTGYAYRDGCALEVRFGSAVTSLSFSARTGSGTTPAIISSIKGASAGTRLSLLYVGTTTGNEGGPAWFVS